MTLPVLFIFLFLTSSLFYPFDITYVSVRNAAENTQPGRRRGRRGMAQAIHDARGIHSGALWSDRLEWVSSLVRLTQHRRSSPHPPAAAKHEPGAAT